MNKAKTQDLAPKILYEDNQLIVINKPAGLVVNRAESVRGETVQDWMDVKLKSQSSKVKSEDRDEIKKEFWARSGVVHRLDKETSGVMVLAKSSEAFQNLKNQFKNRQTQKEYIALVHGALEPKKGDINLPLARNPLNRMRFVVRLGGRQALTFYEVEKTLEKNGEKYSLVRLQPRTGRTHQIRVHLKHIGHPLVADLLYLSKKQLAKDLSWCPRLFLHAAKLIFSHPGTKEKRQFKAELPKELEKTIEE
ncbi:hypothetical protein A2160_05890 [Candidatus Beckwithbacteria bacterium RBG_13_42_9]|uniref:Pseudouridine synthase n=1 Tax=Candidatus Beckwithbacteria bacterium RBG_13_42_9 TaxID=1797457 RepID=A0A1F5E572_9BACT|nr:MAG: hypothetical protein A2160_05890 [Candidatus Beckwithbacteria bacterium RBG_13_42_9]